MNNVVADELVEWGACFLPSVVPCRLSAVTFRIHSALFSDWRHTVSSRFFDTHAPLVFTGELGLSLHTCCILSCLRCNGHSLLLKCYRSRADRIENPLCSACSHSTQGTSSLILHCTAMWESLRCSVFGDSPSLYDLKVPGPGKLLSLWGSKVFRCTPISWKGSVTPATTNVDVNNTCLLFFQLICIIRVTLALLSPTCYLDALLLFWIIKKNLWIEPERGLIH